MTLRNMSGGMEYRLIRSLTRLEHTAIQRSQSSQKCQQSSELTMGKNPQPSNDGTLEKGFLLISFSALSHQTMKFFSRYFSYFFLMSRTNSNNFVPTTSKKK